MAKGTLYEIWIRKGAQAGPFQVADETLHQNYAEMTAIAKALFDEGKVDEAVVLEKRVVKRFSKYTGDG